MKIALMVLGGLVLLGLVAMAVFVFYVQNVETPAYRVVTQEGDFEVRDYPPLVVAEVRRQGPRQEALRAGFGPLARYIFAEERGGERISMTAPVTQQRPERISMTAPVTAQAIPPAARPAGAPEATAQTSDPAVTSGATPPAAAPATTAEALPDVAQGDDWAVRFIMPARYGLEQLPAPAGSDIRLSEVPPRRVAAIRFSGRASDELIASKEEALRAWLAARDLTAAAPAIYAFYNDPFTPGFLRRNEVLIDLAEAPARADSSSPGAGVKP
ncbi:MAG: heme-binding protein [Chromatiaceae bacterium]|nr:heme-binding protein [Chromatiaceae bacterium]